MRLLHNIYISIVVLLVSVLFFGYAFFEFQLSGVSKSDVEKTVVIKSGSVDKIARTLHHEGLIRDVFVFKVYSRLVGKVNLKAATYRLSPNMGTKMIIDILYSGKGISDNQISITFKEGFNVRKFISIVVENTDINEEEILSVLSDKVYLKELIDEYWFLTDEILDDKIYYALEGYLYPNTYFVLKDASIKEIISTLLDETKKQLSPYQEKIKENKMTVHEILTLASLVELEGNSLEERKGIASVFFNRLDKGMTLGSDVTTYYGARINMGDRDLYASEVKECNDYNTRCSTFLGLPISPIANPSIDSIVAVLEPIESDYYYFVADKNGKIYFAKTNQEHNSIINKLKREGLWFQY